MKKIILSIFILHFFIVSALLGQEKKDEVINIFEQPILITSAGQSAEVQIASVLAKRAGLSAALSKAAFANELKGIRTLVIVLGVSLKGLGAAGLDISQETNRVQILVDDAQRKNIPILCLHLGGETRRGQLTDDLINTFLPFSKMAIVVESGNKDGLFTSICKENHIPLIVVERAVDALQPLKKAFK
ncbi:MAG: hypothetical protein IBX60_01455 [Candidatus Aminicenantes bacterium]|nr:hypothetical protein [Candidatus Aminicenantes bacterium]